MNTIEGNYRTFPNVIEFSQTYSIFFPDFHFCLVFFNKLTIGVIIILKIRKAFFKYNLLGWINKTSSYFFFLNSKLLPFKARSSNKILKNRKKNYDLLSNKVLNKFTSRPASPRSWSCKNKVQLFMGLLGFPIKIFFF